MRVLAISGRGDYKIGESQTADFNWFGIGDSAKEKIKTVKKGDEVEIKSHDEGGKKIVDDITVTKKYEDTGTTNPNMIKFPDRYMSPKTPEERTDIKKQAIGHMASRSLKGIEGVNINNYQEEITKLYNLFRDLVA